MASEKKLSLNSAIFINLNIMMGAGLFANTILLSKQMEAASIFIYPIIGIMMFPLIFTMSKLVERHPSGGFYSYAQPISSFWGFFSCWSYFIGKLASGSLTLYVASTILRNHIVVLQQFSTLHISFSIITLFTILNLKNIQIGAALQKIFFSAKSIPVLFVLLVGIFYFDSSTIIASDFEFSSIPLAILIAIYCFTGFEGACSLSRKIENPTINGPKAIFYSFATVIILYTVYQILLYGLLKAELHLLSDYTKTYPFLVTYLPFASTIQSKIALFLNSMIAISALGGSYGVMYSNTWNLYTLAENKHVSFAESFLKLNKHGIPYLIILLEASIFFSFIYFTQGYQILLQQTTAFGVTIAYTISVFAFLSQTAKERSIPLLACLTCSGFIGACVYSVIQQGVGSLQLFIYFMIFGILMFFYQKNKFCSVRVRKFHV
jgi:amino acid transporter